MGIASGGSLLLVGLAFVVALPAAAEISAPGETIEGAAYADLTPGGLEALAGLIPALLPSSFPLPASGDEGGWWCLNYAYGLGSAWVYVSVGNATITPGNGVLDITAELMVSVNDASDPFQLMYEALCTVDVCEGYVDPFPVTVVTTMALDVVDDGTGVNRVDATVGPIDLTYRLAADHINLPGCFVGDVEGVLNWFGLSLYDLILDQVDVHLRDAVADIGPTLEETVEGAFASATIVQEIDLNGAVVQLTLEPSDVVISPDGARVRMSGSTAGGAADCVAAYDPGGSLRTPSLPPDLGAAPSTIAVGHHVALLLSDDFTNQAVYALWRGGLLCYALEPGGTFPLDTSIFNVLTGSVFADLFPEAQPVSLQTASLTPPSTVFDGGHDIDVQLQDLGLQFYTQLDGREARIVTVSLDSVVGVDLGFDGPTGHLGIEVDLGAAGLTPTVTYNDFYPDSNPAIIAGFSGRFGGIVNAFVGGLLEGLGYPLPSFSGIGLVALDVGPMGNTNDWLGAFAWAGATTYPSTSGCGSDGQAGGLGCASDKPGKLPGTDVGCGAGCATSPGSIGLWPALGVLILLRRRK